MQDHTKAPCARCTEGDAAYLESARRREALTQKILALFCEHEETSAAFAGLTADAVLYLHDEILDAVTEYGKGEHVSNLERFAALIGQGVDPKDAASRVRGTP